MNKRYAFTPITFLFVSMLNVSAFADTGDVYINGYFLSGTAQYDPSKGAYISPPFPNFLTPDPSKVATDGYPPYYEGQVVSQPVNFGGSPIVYFGQTDQGPAQYDNSVSFQSTGAFQHGSTGDEFQFGTLTFTNGIFDGEYVYLNLFITTFSTNAPGLNGHTLALPITVVMNPGIGTPADGADWLYFPNFLTVGSLRVFEAFNSPTGSNVGSVELWGVIGSLYPTEFRNPTGAAFLDPSVTNAITPTIPEPESFAMLLSGLGLLGFVARRRKRKAA